MDPVRPDLLRAEHTAATCIARIEDLIERFSGGPW